MQPKKPVLEVHVHRFGWPWGGQLGCPFAHVSVIRHKNKLLLLLNADHPQLKPIFDRGDKTSLTALTATIIAAHQAACDEDERLIADADEAPDDLDRVDRFMDLMEHFTGCDTRPFPFEFSGETISDIERLNAEFEGEIAVAAAAVARRRGGGLN